ncbi:TIGR01457 family HAD-type hydrolase [Halobacillus seohaensis]|uniref:TIGR01457 family HAD-type hydrolase n=1 Tax=Halobacillus seohaensis TaxID=447421 RepID=A0ABW2ES71_9BACI
MKSYKAYLIDLDGTMYRGKDKVPGASSFVQRLNECSVPYLFVTNNSSTKPIQVANKLNNMDIIASKSQVFTSSMATAKYIHFLSPGAKVFIIGEEGLYFALEQEGLEIVNTQADYVVIGIDRNLSYEKLAEACLQVRNGAKLISTNKDVAIPTERGMLPGNGALTSVVSVSTGVTPTFIGKPEPIIMEQAIQKLGVEKEEVLMVGDNYQTDIMAGIQSGLDTLMVETGVSSFESIKNFEKQPTFKVENLFEWVL